jgi:hypothetical protein
MDNPYTPLSSSPKQFDPHRGRGGMVAVLVTLQFLVTVSGAFARIAYQPSNVDYIGMIESVMGCVVIVAVINPLVILAFLTGYAGSTMFKSAVMLVCLSLSAIVIWCSLPMIE